jgi:hypothetical protein
MVSLREKVDVKMENISTVLCKLEAINAFISEKNTEECLS